jgi:5-methylcytosine-specific restriction protein A
MRFCLEPGCQTRTMRARCEDHERHRDLQQRGSSTERGYGWRWRTQARAFLAQYLLCGMRPGGVAPVMSACHEDDRVTAATDVDHVEPHRGDEGLFWDEANWQALCGECHKRKTGAGR